MSLKEDIANAEIMVANLKELAKGGGVSPYTYIMQMGESSNGGRLSMESMDFMTFHTSHKWKSSEQIVMMLGLYTIDEIDSIIEKEPHIIHRSPNLKFNLGAVYWKCNNEGYSKVYRKFQFMATTATDGWSMLDWVKYQLELGLKTSFINWSIRNPMEVKE